MPLEKTLIGCGRPSSRISKSSRVRSVTRRPSGPMTVVYTGTVWVVALKTPVCWRAAIGSETRNTPTASVALSGAVLPRAVRHITRASACAHARLFDGDGKLVDFAVERGGLEAQDVLPVQLVGHAAERRVQFVGVLQLEVAAARFGRHLFQTGVGTGLRAHHAAAQPDAVNHVVLGLRAFQDVALAVLTAVVVVAVREEEDDAAVRLVGQRV